MNAIAKPNPNDSIARFRESHHRIAQYFALGMTDSMISHKTGVSRRRLTILKGSPAFCDLIAEYSKDTKEKLIVAQEAIAELGVDTIITTMRVMNDRVHQAEDGDLDLTMSVLSKTFEVHADRFGFGKHSTTTHKHDFAASLDNAIARSGKTKEVADLSNVIDVEVAIAHQSKEPQRLAEPEPTPITQRGLPAPQPTRRSLAAVLSPVRRRRVA